MTTHALTKEEILEMLQRRIAAGNAKRVPTWAGPGVLHEISDCTVNYLCVTESGMTQPQFFVRHRRVACSDLLLAAVLIGRPQIARILPSVSQAVILGVLSGRFPALVSDIDQELPEYRTEWRSWGGRIDEAIEQRWFVYLTDDVLTQAIRLVQPTWSDVVQKQAPYLCGLRGPTDYHRIVLSRRELQFPVGSSVGLARAGGELA